MTALAWLSWAGLAGPVLLFFYVGRWLWRHFLPRSPEVRIANVGGGGEGSNRTGRFVWVSAEVAYEIYNDNDFEIYEVATGARNAQGEYTFPYTSIPVIRPKGKQGLSGMRFSPAFLATLHGSNAVVSDITYWARFRDAKRRCWEASCDLPDPVTRVRRLWRGYHVTPTWAGVLPEGP